MILKSDLFVRLLGLIKMSMVIFIWSFVYIMGVLIVRKALYVNI